MQKKPNNRTQRKESTNTQNQDESTECTKSLQTALERKTSGSNIAPQS
jgi:hypothetical protein